MRNSIYKRLLPVIGPDGDKIVKTSDFNKFYGNFIAEVLFRGEAQGIGQAPPCNPLCPAVPYWPYENIDFELDGTLADICLDENFTEVFNNIFKKGFKIKGDYTKEVGEYTSDIEENLVPLTEKIAADRSSRPDPADAYI